MTEDPPPEDHRKRLIGHEYKRRPLRNWIIPLLIVLAIIIFLPRLLELLE